MQRWYVLSPEYSEVIPVLDDGTGPMEYCRDVIEIEADTKRDKIPLPLSRHIARAWRPTA